MTNTVQTFKLGYSISDYRYDEREQRLYISGPALEEGTWTGMNGSSAFFPRQVIHDGSHLFNGVDFVCEHMGLTIGKVIRVVNTEFGFNVIEGYITHRPSILAILSGEKTGFSIEAAIQMDPVRRVAEKIVEAINISLVEEPACRTCGIDYAQMNEPCPYEGTVHMSKKIESNSNAPASTDPTALAAEPATETAETEPIVAEAEPVTEPVEAEPVTEDPKASAYRNLEEAADAFKAARKKLADLLLTEPTGTEPVPEVETEVTVETEPVPEQVTEVVVEQAPEPIPEPIAEVALSADEGSVQIPVSDANTADLATIKIALSEAATTVSGVTDQLVKLSGFVKELEAKLAVVEAENAQYREKVETLETELQNNKATERETLIGEIMAIDPEIDNAFVESMSVTQLSAYKSNVQRIATRPLIDGEKKSVKRDEATNVELSAPKKENEVDFTDSNSRKKFIADTLSATW